LVEVVSVTKKGQATIPKRLRAKYGIKDKVIVEETECGIVFRPIPTVDQEFGSLKDVFKGETSRQLLEETRKEEFAKDKELMKRVHSPDL
jgi:antitoxin PrlF